MGAQGSSVLSENRRHASLKTKVDSERRSPDAIPGDKRDAGKSAIFIHVYEVKKAEKIRKLTQNDE